MAITGEKGLLFWNEETQSIKLTTEIWQDDRMNYTPKVEIFSVDCNPLRNELIEFVDCVSTTRKPFTDVENAIQVARNLDLLSKSFSHQ
jgi:predicted dehydrogenase